MATKTKPPKEVKPPKEPKIKERLSDNEVLSEALKEGWVWNNHPLTSRRFFENTRTGKTTHTIKELRSLLGISP